MAKKKAIVSEGAAAKPAPSSDTSFQIGNTIYDFTRHEFFVPGTGLVNVKQLRNEAPEKFDALCVELVQNGSGFITVIE